MHSTSPIRYRVNPLNPAAHVWEVELIIDSPAPEGQRFALPAWIPGSYMIRDFSRTLIEIHARDAKGPIGIRKLDKDTWLADPAQGAITLRYTVYGWELTVRCTHLDQTHGYFNGTSLFLLPSGQEQRPCEVELLRPADPKCKGWRVATAMPALNIDKTGFGTYRADDYDELIDHPVEMGQFVEHTFDVDGIPHRLAVTGHVSADLERFTDDLENICAEHIALFNEPAPMPNYLFMLMVLNKGYGGLEHRNSTSLICQRDDLPQPKQKKPSTTYKKLMGLCSHEYFHSWNVKRIKPAAFTPFDLSKEAHTTLLWWFEGITSYYDDLALRRCEIYSLKSYLEILGQTITRVYRPAGRLKQTLAESSFDAWTKFYKQAENAPNDIISYYAKGAVVGLCLDLLIRLRSEGNHSLDDIMREMWVRYGKTGVGVPEDAIPGLITDVTGLDLSEFFQLALHEHGDLPVPELLESFGIKVIFRPAESPSDSGGLKPKLDIDTLMNTPLLGATTVQAQGGAKIKSAFDDGAAQRCGLSAGDIIIAIDGLQVDHKSLHKRLGERYIGTTVTVHAFRRDTLMQFEMELLAPPSEFVYLIDDPDASDAAIERREKWLRSNQQR